MNLLKPFSYMVKPHLHGPRLSPSRLIRRTWMLCSTSPLFRPDGLPPAAPEDAGLTGFVCVRTEASDGIATTSWYRPPDQEKAPIVVLCHGRRGHIGKNLNRALTFLDAGCGVFLLGYRGYGGNPGRASEQGLIRDLEGALEWLNAEGTPNADIVLYGRSLGSGVVVPVAARSRFRGVILGTPISSIPDVAARTHPRIPSSLLGWMKFNNLDLIGSVCCPILMLHGQKDTIVPPACALKLYQRADAPKAIVWFSEGRHTDLYRLHGADKSVRDYLMALRNGTDMTRWTPPEL